VYSNFSNKEELFLALIDRRFAQDAQGYPGIINFMNDGLKVEAGSDFKSQVTQDRTWNILMVDFFLYAIREGSNRKELSTRLENLRGLMSKNLTELYKQMEKKPMLPVAELPWSVFSLGVGMMLQFYIDPDGLPDGLYERALKQLLKSG
jgi:AcrR family transcriptional regulator